MVKNTVSRLRLKKPGGLAPFLGLLPLFMMAHFGHHLVNSLPIPLLPMIRQDFDLNFTQSGLLISAFTLSYGLSQFPAGWLADRMGPRIILTVSICGVSVAGFLFGLAQSYPAMLALMLAMGVLGGGYHPTAPPLILAAVDPKKHGRAMGLHMVGGSAPFFLAPLIAVALASVWGWRGTFIALAVPTMLFGVVFYLALKRYSQTAETEKSRSDLPQNEARPPTGIPRRLVPFIVLSTFTHAVTFCIVAFIPLFLIDRFGLDKKSAAAFLSVYYSAGLWASLLGGILSDRIGGVPVVFAACFIAAPMILFLNVSPSVLLIGFLLFVLGITNYVRTPVSESYIVSQASARHRSTLLGIYYFSNMEGGGVLTPLMGFLIDRYGFYFSFSAAGAVLLLVALICLIWLRYASRPDAPEPPDNFPQARPRFQRSGCHRTPEGK